jgi:hypothetical protein
MLDSAAAYNMLVGNNPRATGRLVMADVDWIFSTYLVGSVNEADRNRRAMRYTLQWIRANPAAWLRLVPLKVSYLWGLEGREHAWLYSVGYFGARAPATVWTWGALVIVTFPVLAVAAVLGLLKPGVTTEPAGAAIVMLLGLMTILHAISFGESRFHLPLVPFLAVLAVRGIGGNTPPLTGIRRTAGLALALGLGAAWVSQAPELTARLVRLAAADGWQAMLPY